MKDDLRRKRPKRKILVNWREKELVNWLGTKQESTEHIYRKAFETYAEFTGMTAKQLIDEAQAEVHAEQRDWGMVKRKLLRYRKWLLNNACML